MTQAEEQRRLAVLELYERQEMISPLERLELRARRAVAALKKVTR